MMKKIPLLLIVALLLACTQNSHKDHFVIKGSIEGLKDGWLYLYYSDPDGKRVKDSSALEDGRFTFRGKIEEPSIAYLQLKEEKRNELNSASFFLEPAEMKATLKLNNFTNGIFDGSLTQNDLAELNKSKEPLREQMKPLNAEFDLVNNKYREAIRAKMNEAELEDLKDRADSVRAKFDPFNTEITAADLRFFKSHPTSPVTAYMLRFHVSEWPLDSLQQIYNNLGAKVQQTDDGKDLLIQIEQLRSGSPGSPAADFSTIDINGDSLKLSGFRGKYVLLDFWASWCGPCRKGNPHLKELYARLKDKGIEFIGISDDDSKPDAWRKAVEKDGLPWRHVLRGLDMAKRLNNQPNDADLSDKYGIHSLPTKILIDRAGMIIGRYSEEAGPLDQKLGEVFGMGETPGRKTGNSHN